MKSWRRSLLSLLISVGLLSAAAPAAMAAPQQAALKINNRNVEFAMNAPIVDQGTTMVPLEATLQAMNAELGDVQDDAIYVVINGKEITLNSKTQLINGVKYAPVRIVGEAAGYAVHWDQQSRTVILISKATGQGARGFLWEVKNNGNTAYLVGSMHFADDSFYPLRSEYEEAFAEADYLGVEIDVSRAADEANQKMIMDLGTYQDGTTLKDHVSEDTYAKVGEILRQNGIEPNAFDVFKPWVVELTMTSLKSMDAGYEAAAGVDLYFIQKAMERKLPIIELESYASQLSMFNGFSKELQEKNLNAVLDHFDVLDESVNQMAEIWKTGNDEQLLELTNSFSEDEEYNKAMLIDRNIVMADKVDGYLKNGKNEQYFIVVGAAHYLGEHGIIKLLEDKGYTVVRK
ncbi:TraB/GumN family protein [Paenibacillus lentus]|uniref:Polysaccharide biosynthesis protein GumN n=1 Tax=Paenibacillus lentus TaxID=1338368 RepID=A0A3S8RPU7_9BACL|nr:TraB/GumN family protein [Paenibacillus lentus]AZK44887.1 polysaccharide biosynthesis protein GumN [Paenibacillus lentus]